MPAFWVKPFGTTDPPKTIAADWIAAEEVDLDDWPILSGPSAQSPPKMGRGDFIVFTAVGHARLFGSGEITASPTYHEHPFWKRRFPWMYRVRVDVWIPDVTDGPRLSEVAPRKVLGRIQAGAPYAALTKPEYEGLVATLRATPSAQTRDGA